MFISHCWIVLNVTWFTLIVTCHVPRHALRGLVKEHDHAHERDDVVRGAGAPAMALNTSIWPQPARNQADAAGETPYSPAIGSACWISPLTALEPTEFPSHGTTP